MRRIRQHLTYANVMVTLLAFVVLTGGTAVALNGQNTVQSDDIGPGAQVKAPDVAANAINGGKVVDNSLTGADVNESTLAGFIRGHMLDGNIHKGDPATPMATVGPYVISLGCGSTGAPGGARLSISAKGPAGNAETEFILLDNDNALRGSFSRSNTLPANANTEVVVFSSPGTGYSRGGGTLLLRSSSGTIVQVDYSAVADGNVNACHVWGSATTG